MKKLFENFVVFIIVYIVIFALLSALIYSGIYLSELLGFELHKYFDEQYTSRLWFIVYVAVFILTIQFFKVLDEQI